MSSRFDSFVSRATNFRLPQIIACGLMLISVGGSVAQADEPVDQVEIRAAIEKSLELINLASQTAIEKRQCFTCHHSAMPIAVMHEARLRGFDIDESNHDAQADHTWTHLQRGQEGYLKGEGQGGGVDTAGYALWTLYESEKQPDEVTDAVVEYILGKQHESGKWDCRSNRPPSELSDFTTTYFALTSLSNFARGDSVERLASAYESASDWLRETEAADTEDAVFRYQSLAFLAERSDDLQGLANQQAEDLLDQQRDDGGWGQTDDMESDAYATGSVLAALAQSGFLDETNAAYQRGVRYLLDRQQDDGSWHVVSRSKPFQTYFETGFPHEADQFISTSATCWAVLALLQSLKDDVTDSLIE